MRIHDLSAGVLILYSEKLEHLGLRALEQREDLLHKIFVRVFRCTLLLVYL